MTALRLTLLAVLLGLPLAASGDVVVQHQGANDPINVESFIKDRGLASNGSAVLDDLGLGIDAWALSTPAAQELAYRKAVSAADRIDAYTYGFRLSANMRIVGYPLGSAPGDSMLIALFDNVNSKEWKMMWGLTGEGKPIVKSGASTYTLDDATPGYHLYQLDYDPSAGNVDLWVDGVSALSDIPFGAGGKSPQIAFGDYSGNAWAVQANYNWVAFEVGREGNPLPPILPGQVLIWDGEDSTWSFGQGDDSHWDGGALGDIPTADFGAVVLAGTCTVDNTQAAKSLAVGGTGTVAIVPTGDLAVAENASVGGGATQCRV